MSQQPIIPQNPVVILVSEQGAGLIKAVCNAALKQSGVEALLVVNTILGNMKDIKSLQTKVPANIEQPKSNPVEKGK